ncbi:MAG: nucleoside permease [Phycisphaerae bacterium]|nr:nucleoside permease [Phycisphaerae bacterium]
MSPKSKVQPDALASVETARTESHQPLVRLSIMMFVEFAVWGAWSVLLGKHMEHLGFSGKQIGLVYLTTALGAMLSPLVAGWIADRFMPNQIFTGIVHLLGAVLLFIAWPQTQFGGMFVVLLIYAILYMPTIALTNAIAFHHMKDSKKFGNIRVWGTIGWIVVNWIISGYLLIWGRYQPDAWHVGDCLLFAAVLSAVMGVYCFTLPNTPPAKQAKNPYAFVEAFRLMSNRNFAVLLVISFVVAIELPFYYSYTIIFLTDTNSGVGLEPGWANAAMSIGQVGEIALMLLLAPSLRHLGMRKTIVLGILAWPLRYAIFAIGQPWYLVVAAQALHGICYSFFFAGGMIAVERLSPKDIRASAQGLLLFATNGVGMLIGNLISGPLYDVFVAARVSHAWPKFFLVPIVVTILGAIVFAVLFKERQFQTDAAEIEQREAVAV